MMTFDQFQAFLYKAEDRAFEEKTSNTETYFTKYTKPGNTKKADVRTVTGSKLGPAAFTSQGGQAHLDEYALGTERVLKYKKLTISMIYPEDLEEDLYNGGRVDDDKIGFFKSLPKDLEDSHEWAFELICTDLQVRGESTTATATWPGAGRDGVALFTTHTTTRGVPISWLNRQVSAPMNLLTVAEGITMLEAIPDETGRPGRPAKRIGIVYGRYWQWRIGELLKALGQPDTANVNTPNALTARYEKVEYVPIFNPYLPNTNTTWMLLDMDNHQLKHYMKLKPTLNRDVLPRTGNKVVRTRSRFAVDFESAKWALLAG